MSSSAFASALAGLIVCVGATTSAATTRSGLLTWTFDLSAHEPGADAELWVPYPVSDGDQTISDVVITGDFAASGIYTDNNFGIPMLYARWPKGATSRVLTFSFWVERNEVMRREFPTREGAWDKREYRKELAATRFGPVDGETRELARKITRGLTTVVAKAHAIYDWAIENMSRDPSTRGCGAGDVCQLLSGRAGKCADIHSVVTALARSVDVPSREVFGIRLSKKGEDDVTQSYHCWIEFLAPGYGWVPMDPADVLKAVLTDHLALSDPKTDAIRAYYWGAIDPYRVKLSVGRDVTLNPAQPDGPLNYFMYPHARVGATTLDWLDAAAFRYSVRYSDVARAAATPAVAAQIRSERTPEHLQAARFAALAEAKHGIILDVRTPGEVARGRIRDASMVDFAAPRFEQRVSFIDHQRPIFVYCALGPRSADAALVMSKLGFVEVYVLDGGLVAWAQAGFEVDRGGGSADAHADGMNLASFDALLTTHSRVLVDFHTQWCEPCKKMAPIVDALTQTWKGRASVMRIDVEQSESLAAREHVQGVPVFVIYDNGKERWRHSGLISREALEAELGR